MTTSHHDRDRPRKAPPRFLPLRKMYWFKIQTDSGKQVLIAKWAQNWNVVTQEFMPLPCPYGDLAAMYGYRPLNATDAMQLSDRHPQESIATAYEEAAKLATRLLPGPDHQPVEGFIAGDGI